MIDPLSAATTFATIVSLLADYVDSRRDGTSPSAEEFLRWLSEENRTDILTAISRSHETTVSLKAIFNEKSDEILRRLRTMDLELARVAAAFGPIGELALAIRPEARLSEGALAVLVAMETAGAGMAIEVKDLGGAELVFDAKSINFVPQERRFYEDDISMLVESGLLRLSHNAKGGRIFHVTRSGARLARAVMQSSDEPPQPKEQ